MGGPTRQLLAAQNVVLSDEVLCAPGAIAEMSLIYLTHCSHKKNERCKETREAVTPEVLYTATPTQRFVQRCRVLNVPWAVFSDKYGIWFPEVRHEWYEKDPDTVTEAEFSGLVADFDAKLSGYSEICFYHNPGRFHPLRLLRLSELSDRVKPITHLWEIT